jgi:hypothetical protein
VGKPNPHWKKEDNTTISLVFGVGISSPLADRHRSTSQSGKEMILDQLPDFSLIYSGFLEHFWMGSDHGARGKNPKWRFTGLQEMELVCVRQTEMVMEVKGALGFGLSHC